MKISVIIPTYGSWDLTARCLDALEPDLRSGTVHQIVVVDDGSTDASRERIAADQRVLPVLLERNRGFAGAVNAGVAAADGDAFLLLNNDTIVQPGAISTLARSLSDASVGIVGPRLLYADGTIQHAGLAFVPGHRQPWLLHNQLDSDLPDANVARDYAALVAAALLVRRATWDDVNGLDDGYINGCEDVAFCLEAWMHGWRVRYEPAATIVHLEAATRGQSSGTKANELRFTKRWASVVAGLPSIEIGDSPVIQLSASGTLTGAERLAWRTLLATARAGIGARVIVGAHDVDRARAYVVAQLGGRKRLHVNFGARPRQRPDVLFTAAATRDDAVAAHAAAAQQYWTPAPSGRERLLEAGVRAEDIRVVRLAPDATIFGPVAPDADGITTWSDERDLGDEKSLAATLARTRVLVLPASADPYHLLLTAALTAGCAVVTTAEAADGFDLADLLEVAEPARLRATAERLAHSDDDGPQRAAATRRQTLRRRSVLHTAARMRELARVLTHGTIDGSRATMDGYVAARRALTV